MPAWLLEAGRHSLETTIIQQQRIDGASADVSELATDQY